MNRKDLAAVLTTWQRRYQRHPERFKSKFDAPEVYGKMVADYLFSLREKRIARRLAR